MTTNRFQPTSRYYGSTTDEHQTADGRTIVYIKRRFIPTADRFETIREHSVLEGERPDHVAARELGDPTLFWQLCDANEIMHPDELTETPGERIRITLPEGIPGVGDG
jgi:hypothetical protein